MDKVSKEDLDYYYKVQFRVPLSFIRTAIRMLKELNILIKSNEVDKKEVYDLIRFEILIGFSELAICRKSLSYLEGKKYFKQIIIKSFFKEFTNIENNLYEYTKKFANMGATCQN